jgi:pimeloyl-ACP methyl ester carboxylesterase
VKKTPRSLLTLLPIGVAIAVASTLFLSCTSTSKQRLELQLGELDKNRPIAEAGLERGELRLDHDGEEVTMEFVYHHAPALEPRAGTIPLVLVHGTPSTLFAWTEVIYGTEEFDGLRTDRDVYAVEVIGHGIAPGDLAPYDFDVCARHVIAMAEALGIERMHLAGSSYGGEFVWRAALEDPERVASIVLMDSSGYPRLDEDWLSEELQMRENSLADLGWMLNSHDRITAALEPHFGVVPPERVDEFYLVCTNAHNWKAMIDLARDENGTRAAEIPNIAQPALIVWGDNDIAYPPAVYAQRFVDDLPRGELFLLEDTGHYPHEERPELVVPGLREFFTRVEAE